MRRLLFAGLLACASLWGTQPQAANLITNAGFDETTGSVTLSAASPGPGWDNTTAFTGWQVYCFGPSGTPGSVQYTALPDAQAVSAPNLFTYTKLSAVDDSAVRREVVQAPVVGGHVYRHSVYARDVDGTLNTHDVVTALFNNGSFINGFGAITHDATAAWENVENTFVAASTATSASFQFHLFGATGSMQFDSAALEDITAQNRMTNGGFEDSGTRLLNWNVIEAGRDIHAAIVSDAAEGTRALRIYQNSGTTGDGLVSKDGGHWLPWLGAHDMRLSYSLKDDPTLATGETVTVQVVAFDASSNLLSAPLTVTRTPGSGSYTRFEETIGGFPAATAFVTVNFRIDANAGASGDVLLDDVVVLDAGSASAISLDQSSLDLGQADPSTGPASRDLLITNSVTTGGTLAISGLGFSGANAADFSAAIVEGASPLAPGASLKVRVTYTPRIVGHVTVQATLQITHDGANEASPLDVPVTVTSGFLTPVETAPENLLSNWGWDAQAATVTLGDNEAAGMFDSGVTFTDWQVYTLGNGGSSTFTSAPSAEAISAPNVFTFNKVAASGDAAVRRDSSPSAVEPNHVYKHGISLRDGDGTLNTFSLASSVFSGTNELLGVYGGFSGQAAADWQRFERSFLTADPASSSAAWGLRMSEATGSFTLDSAALQDITASNRMINGGFENSATAALDWSIFAVGGIDTQAQIVSDAAEGSRALRLFQTTVPGGSDGGINKDAQLLPWIKGHGLRLRFAIKDSPVISTGDKIHLLIVAFKTVDGSLALDSVPLDIVCPAGQGEYIRYEYRLPSMPADVDQVTVSIRLTNSEGAAAPADVLIDDVQVHDLDTLPVNAAQSWTLY